MLLAGLLIILLWNVSAYWMLQQDIVVFWDVLIKNIGQLAKR